MKIIDQLKTGEPMLSYEVFPPSTSTSYDKVISSAYKIAGMKPDFMSVTCNAGGSTTPLTVDVAADLQDKCGVTTIAHLTCNRSSKEDISSQLSRMKEKGVENVLALRGDIPKGGYDEMKSWTFRYAVDLVRIIKEEGDFCIGSACYPEGHPESDCSKNDIAFLKDKVDAGCDFLTTQMFFDNNLLYSYLYKLRQAGINVPVIAGIMPVTNARSVSRIAKLSGAQFPPRFRAVIDRFGDSPEAMKQAGIAYATDQIIDLYANGVNAIHVYSMNKPDIAAKIRANLASIVPSIELIS